MFRRTLRHLKTLAYEKVPQICVLPGYVSVKQSDLQALIHDWERLDAECRAMSRVLPAHMEYNQLNQPVQCANCGETLLSNKLHLCEGKKK